MLLWLIIYVHFSRNHEQQQQKRRPQQCAGSCRRRRCDVLSQLRGLWCEDRTLLRHLPGEKQVPERGMGAGSDDPPVRVVRQRAKRLSLLLRKVVGRPTSLWSWSSSWILIMEATGREHQTPLPAYVIKHMMSFLTPRDLLNVSVASKCFRSIIDEEVVVKVGLFSGGCMWWTQGWRWGGRGESGYKCQRLMNFNGSEVMIVVCDEWGGACDGHRVGGGGGVERM